MRFKYICQGLNNIKINSKKLKFYPNKPTLEKYSSP